MFTFRLLVAAAVAAVTLTALVLPSYASSGHRTRSLTEQVRGLRQGIRWQRSTTWHFEGLAGVARTRTEYAERRTTSIPFLSWIEQTWNDRRIAAKKQAARTTAHPSSLKAYGYLLAMRAWHSSAEWSALDQIVTPESGWNPCASYPGNHDCGYAGSNACGVPQRNPCPYSWRGNLYGTRWAQVRELIRYVRSRYGDPLHALAVRQSSGTY